MHPLFYVIIIRKVCLSAALQVGWRKTAAFDYLSRSVSMRAEKYTQKNNNNSSLKIYS